MDDGRGEKERKGRERKDKKKKKKKKETAMTGGIQLMETSSDCMDRRWRIED